MSAVEVLAPVRLETRFVSPQQRTDGINQWRLRLRIYPDEFSIRRADAPPSSDELDRLTEMVQKMAATPPLPEASAFASFAAAVGAGRAHALWRTCIVSNGAGAVTVDRSGESKHVPFATHGVAGLPQQLQVWFVHVGGTRQLVHTLTLDLVEIAKDLDLKILNDPETLAEGKLPKTWWLSYPRAVAVGLGVDLDVGAVPPKLDALVVLGIGETDTAELVDAHNATGRMAVLAPGTPTNTVAGEPTTDLGGTAETIFPLVHAEAGTQLGTASLLTGLTGRVAPGALAMLGGDLDYFGPGSLAVQGFWPVLWGRYLRDVIGAGETEISLARWALRHLAVEGPRPAFRVGEQPYGLLPTSRFAAWVDEPGDALGNLEKKIRHWSLSWRDRAAAAARAARGRTDGEQVDGYLDVLGLHAPSRHWNARAIADRFDLQALRAIFGLPPMDTAWDDTTAAALRGIPAPLAPIGRTPGEGPIPGPPLDEVEDGDLLRTLPTMEPERLFAGRGLKLGLVGHLIREALIAARALVGAAVVPLRAGARIPLGQSLPWADENAYRDALFRGTNDAVAELRESADPDARLVAERFKEVQDALQVIADLWKVTGKAQFRATLAALDTAAFRVDPWLTGIAERRLQRMTALGTPFRLGAYGWVDSPAPHTGAVDGPLAPGPTRAGLLHAPSPAHAQTAALLRDAAVRYPGNDRWKLTLNSANIRAAIALAERVRLGLHPYEALGLEVEKLAGDWETVRKLRKEYPLASGQQERRVCDGAKVLRAAREGAFVGFPADLPARLAPLDEVLDTYADLLVADGAYALVTGRSDLANAAMEAAAGLGAPPELRAVRTPRQATTVRVSAWVLLPSASFTNGANSDPLLTADPAFAAALEVEIGAGAIRTDDESRRAKRARFAAALGGSEEDAPLPSLVGGGYEGLPGSADADLRTEIAADLTKRLADLLTMAQATISMLNALNPDEAGGEAAVAAAGHRWTVDLTEIVPADPTAAAASNVERRDFVGAALKERLSAVAAKLPTGGDPVPPTESYLNALKQAIRTTVGRTDLPILPLVSRSLLPVFRANTEVDRAWLEIVAAVRPRLAPLEAMQLDQRREKWPAAVAAPGTSIDPWHPSGPVVVAYGPGVQGWDSKVGIAAVDGWSDSIPHRRHATSAAFGFNSPKSRAPQAVLVAVPPDISQRLDNAGLLEVILETRELVQARSPRQIAEATLPHPTSTAFVSAVSPRSFLDGWPP